MRLIAFVPLTIQVDPVMRIPTHGLAAAAAAGLLFVAGDVSGQQAAPAPAQATPPPSTGGCPDEVRHNATREQTQFESRGKPIPALIYKPRIPNGAGVVLLHGFRGLAGHAPIFDPHAVQLASRGYTVLVPSYFDARPWRERFNGQDIRRWSEAGTDAVRFVGTQTGVDPARVGLWGYSLGGYVATDAGMSDDGAAAMVVGVSAGTSIYGEMSRGRRPIPVLMIHGRNDPSVSVASMQLLASNMRLRGATVDTELVESNDHAMDGPTWCRVFQLSRRFMDANLLPASTAAAPAA